MENDNALHGSSDEKESKWQKIRRIVCALLLTAVLMAAIVDLSVMNGAFACACLEVLIRAIQLLEKGLLAISDFLETAHYAI